MKKNKLKCNRDYISAIFGITIERSESAQMRISESSIRRLAPVFLFLSAFCWSLCGVLVKSSTWNALSMATFRGLLSFAFYGCIIRRWPKLNRTKIIIALCYFIQSALIVSANKYTSAGCATALQNTSPIYIICLNAIFLKHKPLRRDILACFFMFLGISLTLVGSRGSNGVVGNILALVSALFYAAVFFFSSRPGVNTIESLFLGNGLFLLLLPVFLSDSAVHSSSFSGWMIALACALLSGAIAWLFFGCGIRYASPLQANFITMTEPIMSPLWTFLFLREKMSFFSTVGCIIVIITLVIYNYCLSSKKKTG